MRFLKKKKKGFVKEVEFKLTSKETEFKYLEKPDPSRGGRQVTKR